MRAIAARIIFRAAGRYDSVTGDDDREGVGFARLTDCPRDRAYALCKQPIGHRLSIGNRRYCVAERRSLCAVWRRKRQIEILTLASKPFMHLSFGCAQHIVIGYGAWLRQDCHGSPDPERQQIPIIGAQRQWPDRAGDSGGCGSPCHGAIMVRTVKYLKTAHGVQRWEGKPDEIQY